MGVWEGIYKGRQSALARKADKEELDLRKRKMAFLEEEFATNTQLKRKKMYLDFLKSYTSKDKLTTEKAEADSALIQRALSLNIDLGAASYLSQSGQLEALVSIGEKRVEDGTLSPKWIATVNKRVGDVLGDKNSPQARAMAMQAAITKTEDSSTDEGKAESLFAAIFAASDPKDYEEIAQRFNAELPALGAEGQTESITPPPIPGLGIGAKGISSSEVKRIRSGIIERIAATFGAVYFQNDQGNLVIDPQKSKVESPENLEKVIVDLTNKAVSSMQGIGALDYTSALTEVTDFAISLNRDYSIPLVKMPDFTSTFTYPNKIEPLTPRENSFTVITPTDATSAGQGLFDSVKNERDKGS